MPFHAQYSLIALTGFMGSGKSSVGKALASFLGWSFVDLDDEVEKVEGRKIREIFVADGELRFREIEMTSLRSVLAGGPPANGARDRRRGLRAIPKCRSVASASGFRGFYSRHAGNLDQPML